MPAPVLKFRKVRPGAVAPAYMTAGAAGMDLASAAPEPITLVPGGRAAVPTGLELEIPEGYEGQVRPRSGLAPARSFFSIRRVKKPCVRSSASSAS